MTDLPLFLLAFIFIISLLLKQLSTYLTTKLLAIMPKHGPLQFLSLSHSLSSVIHFVQLRKYNYHHCLSLLFISTDEIHLPMLYATAVHWNVLSNFLNKILKVKKYRNHKMYLIMKMVTICILWDTNNRNSTEIKKSKPSWCEMNRCHVLQIYLNWE